MTAMRWIRSIDALDLMIKSRWQEDRAKQVLAAGIAVDMMDWNAEWGKYYNPLTGKTETITGYYHSSFTMSPIGILFRTIENQTGQNNKNLSYNCAVRCGTPGFIGYDESLKYNFYSITINYCEWQTGTFRVTGVDSELFFAVHGLSVSRADLLKLLTVDVIEEYKSVLDFDINELGLTWVNTGSPLRPEESALPIKSSTRGVVSGAALNRWWQGLTEQRDPMSIRALWEKAKLDFPDKTVPRRAVENLASGRKRGRKPIGP